jgi:chemosensory pili system protein ChpA (sensor histidine kinase/response regulator)
MPSNIDPQMLDKLLMTIRSFVSVVLSGIETFLLNREEHEALEDAYQNIHQIIDVASMINLDSVCYIATSISEMIENLASESDSLETEQENHLVAIVNLLEPYLNSIQNGNDLGEEILIEAIQHYRRFKNLPQIDDSRVIEEIISGTYENAVIKTSDSDNHWDYEIGNTNDSDDNLNLDMDFGAELLEGFLIEAEDYLDTIGQLLPELSENTQQSSQLQQIRRSVHTLKGAAGVVGLQTVSLLAHRMEDVLDDLYDGRIMLSSQIKEIMFSTFDLLEDFLRDKKAQGQIDSQAQALYQIYDDISGIDTTVQQDVLVTNQNLNESEESYQHDSDFQAGEEIQPYRDVVDNEATKGANQQQELIRVPIHRLDEIVRLVGELVINRSIFEQHLANLLHQVEELHLSIDRLQRTSTTIETQYEVSALVGGHSTISTNKGFGLSRAGADWSGIVEFDELEFDRYSDFHLMSRDLTETSADIGALGTEFRELLGEFDSYLTRQNRLTSEIQDKLMHFRMIPLSSLSTRLHRAVRVTAKQRNKEVCLIIDGEEVQFDKRMLDELNEALLHILRNSVDHGIESPTERESVGKSCEGTIRLHAFREGTQIVVKIKDDGAGLNPQRIRVKAVQNGLISDAEIESWTDEQLYTLIFSPGFSTAQEVSEVSGRGVGMDIVHEIITKLKGRIAIESTQGVGITLTMRLPITLALAQVLLVLVNNQTFAIPLADVLQVFYIELYEIETVSNMQVISIDGKIIQVVWLAEALNITSGQSSNEGRLPVIITQIGEQQIALIVDQLQGGRDVVVKTLGAHLHHIYGLIGSTLMGDGSIVLILNSNELIHDKGSSLSAQNVNRLPQMTRTSKAFEILIVDDSFSVRRVVANLVKKAGWEPILAKNGLEALEIIQRAVRLPDLILLDVEMPQMDGYELTSTLRANSDYQNLPIVMLTSRAGEKHRQKAFEVGATEYMIKPYRDSVLLSLINHLISQSREIILT